MQTCATFFHSLASSWLLGCLVPEEAESTVEVERSDAFASEDELAEAGRVDFFDACGFEVEERACSH